MWYDGLFEEVEQLADSNQAKKMSDYMKNQFTFLGIPKPILKSAIKPYLAASRKQELDWPFINICWEKPYREAQYIGVEYILKYENKLEEEDLPRIKDLIQNKSWWEITDALDHVVGSIVMKTPNLKDTMLAWSKEDNLWIRRTAIDFQQKFKEDTDKELLEQVIINNLGSNEFFIDKAIGWSLREYGKTNPQWVTDFLNRYDKNLSNLSKKEAKKSLTI